ncbi:hypothetical protein Leryth_014755 [Lithospermum erythrorhizon]|nr:hypothetical protein Leryth_014755 [Lithospermum erythrorhizon]
MHLMRDFWTMWDLHLMWNIYPCFGFRMIVFHSYFDASTTFHITCRWIMDMCSTFQNVCL